ncbi:MAG: hypothetical protein K2X81_02465 [Candidatus Obscuribacterales bacterium]|nr:hypothetical protein [Candidatus Obscuribacterales bacterium]
MKIQVSLLIVCWALAVAAYSKPVAQTELTEAIAQAPVILEAEEGKVQYDDLKEGETVVTTALSFDCRKQWFKITKVFRNNTNIKIAVGSEMELYNKSNGCIEYALKVKKTNGKLQLTAVDKPSDPYFYTPKDPNRHEKDVLFLTLSDSNPKVFAHYGWFVSPQAATAELEKKIQSLAPANGGKRTIHMPADCN